MNYSLRRLLLAFILLSLPPGLHAAIHGVTILSDSQLAAVKGGYCSFEVCEDAPGTGKCQPIAPTTAAICTFTFCLYEEDTMGRTIIYSCGFAGLSSCTEPVTYRQCVLAFTTSSCTSGTDTPCGVNVVPVCHIDQPDRKCVCDSKTTDEPCDWTNCVPGS